ncbi:MAG: MFS transporter [Ardenticatenaceae bacterium]|nr:MFS transporter [Ardenticatenaceae bacterium]HBY97995.1 MFS transporter [Chloroflexota bacterium]
MKRTFTAHTLPLSTTKSRQWLGLPAGYAALRHRNFRLYWFGQMISLAGTWMQTVAQGWLVYQLTRSPFALGLVGMAASLPILFFSLFGGVLADRLDRRKLLITTQSLAMFEAFIMAWLIWSGRIQIWQIYALAFGLGMIYALDSPARQAFVVELVGREDLPNAIALNATIFNLARVVGPAVAAALLATVGVASAYFINGLTFIAVIVMLIAIQVPARMTSATQRSMLDNLREGLAYIRTDPPTMALIGMVAIVGLFGLPYSTLMPAFADRALHTGVQGYGALLMASGIGALISAFSLASLSSLRHKGKLLTVGDLIFPVMLVAFSLTRSMPLALGLLVLVGGFLVMRATISNILLQTTVPDELRGRVMSVYTMMFLGMTPFGSFQAGVVAEHFGAPAAILIGGLIVWSAAVFIFIRFPRVRRLP